MTSAARRKLIRAMALASAAMVAVAYSSAIQVAGAQQVQMPDATAEIRYGDRIPLSAKRPAIEGYAFWDHLRVDNLDRFGDFGREYLNSVGAGARVNFDRFALDAGVAVPLTRIGIENRRPPTRFLISLTSRLWPWSYQ